MAQFRTTTFREIVDLGHHLIDQLEDLGFSVNATCTLRRYLSSAERAAAAHDVGAMPTEADIDNLAHLVPISQVLTILIAANLTSGFAEQVAALTSGEPGPLRPGRSSKARNQVFELICGAACASFASNVRPAEPDVCCDDNEATWGLACKALYGNPAGAAKRLWQGVQQITNAACAYGLVVAQLTNLLPQDRLRRRSPSGLLLPFVDANALSDAASAAITEAAETIEKIMQQRFGKLWPWPHPRVRGILFVAHGIGYLGTMQSVLVVSRLKSFCAHDSAREVEFATRLQRALEALH